MASLTISPKYQIVLPQAVREALNLTPGQKVQIITYDNRIELIPERDMRAMRGFLKGIDTEIRREENRV